MLICVLLGICNPLSHDKSLNQDNAFCFRLSLMPNFSRSHIGYVGIAYRFQFVHCISVDIHQTFHVINCAISQKSGAWRSTESHWGM